MINREISGTNDVNSLHATYNNRRVNIDEQSGADRNDRFIQLISYILSVMGNET